MIPEPTVKGWQSPIPLSQIAPECIERAARLQRALRPSLERRPPKWIGSVAEFEQAGIADYAREFGRAITDRHFRELMKRTLERDGGRENFAMVELFLHERPKRRAGTQPVFSAASESEFLELHELISGFRNPGEPNSHEEALLWLRSFDVYNRLLENGCNAKPLKNRLLSFLVRYAAALSDSPGALRRNFDRKLQKWIKARGDANAVEDGRRLRKGIGIAPEFPIEDTQLITWHTARNCGGRISQGVRECLTQGKLTPATAGLLRMHQAGKSYVLRRLRDILRPMVNALMPHIIGGRALNDNRATMMIDYSASFSDDCYTADDVTCPVQFYMLDGNGLSALDEHGKVKFARGQMLLFVDYRSWRILGYSLQPEASYNQFGIRTLIGKVMSDFAVPRKLLFEHGVWKKGKLITGGPKWDGVTNEECEAGLRRFGIQFQFANSPQGKSAVERVAAMLQDFMEREPGYTGRNERMDKPQHTKDAERAVRSGAQPEKYFYHFEEWHKRLGEIIEQYNATKQEGRVLDGLSPEEAYEKFQNTDDPPVQYDARCRFLLAYDRKRVLVNKDGIKFKIGKEWFQYCGSEISHLRDTEVFAWFNPESPGELTVTDLHQRNAITVERHIPQGPNSAYDTPNEYAREVAKVKGQGAYSQILYRTLKRKYPNQNLRPLLPTRDALRTAELGREMTAQREEITTRRQAEDRLRERARKKANEIGMPTAILGQHGDEDGYLQLRIEAQRQAEKETESES